MIVIRNVFRLKYGKASLRISPVVPRWVVPSVGLLVNCRR
jgi:hypothetical protein